jgi:hypothetical protein
MPFEAAAAMERDLVDALRRAGYTVTSHSPGWAPRSAWNVGATSRKADALSLSSPTAPVIRPSLRGRGEQGFCVGGRH